MRTKTQHSSLWDSAKAGLGGKCIVLNAHRRKQLKELEKQEQTNSKASRRQEIIKIGAELKELDTHTQTHTYTTHTHTQSLSLSHFL